MTYTIENSGQIQFVTFDALENIPFIRHGFSTRIGGVSQGVYNSLNLGVKTGDSIEDVEQNIQMFTAAVGLNYENLVVSDQVHGDIIKIVLEEDKGKGFFKERDYHGVDGLITNIPGIPLLTIFADCVPIYFVDIAKKVVGLSHAGWKGTRLKIGKKTVEMMVCHYGSDPKDIVALIGPSIKKCCYEVDQFVINEFESSFGSVSSFTTPKKDGKYMLDLWTANKIVLLEAGLRDENIRNSNLCTSCHSDLFYSYRKENGVTGRMGAIIQLI